MGDRGAATSAIETKDATLAARIEVAAHTVADLDRRLGQIDSAIEEATKRGRTTTALTAIEGQRKAREALAGQRQREGVALADLKAERAALGAKGRQMETDAAPIRYVAELVGADADSEQAIRWLIPRRQHGDKNRKRRRCAGFERSLSSVVNRIHKRAAEADDATARFFGR